jgi:hypothetical protein
VIYARIAEDHERAASACGAPPTPELSLFVLAYLPTFFSVRLIRPALHFSKRPDKWPICLPRKANAFVVFSFSQNSSGHASATLIRVFQTESSSCRVNAAMTPMM